MPDQHAGRSDLSRSEVAAQLRSLGVAPGGVLLVHTSFRATRPVEGGPAGLIEALRAVIGPGGTLVMPSWTGDDDEPFDPATTSASTDPGVVAEAFWRLPDVLRSEHPFAFAAVGPVARRIVADPLAVPPHVPNSAVGRVHELDGQVLLLGVNHDADTTVHLAEILGSAPYRTQGLLLHGPARRQAHPARVHRETTTVASASTWSTAGCMSAGRRPPAWSATRTRDWRVRGTSLTRWWSE